jgi:acetyl-CoA carboxylase biotin carboxyl carrier protein
VLTFEQIKELIELVARHRLAGVEIDRSGFKLKIDGFAPAAPAAVAGGGQPALGAAVPGGLPAAGVPAALADGGVPAAAPAATAAAPAGAGNAAGAADPGGAVPAKGPALHIITSPIVGTFYRAASPGTPPFVEVGGHVSRGMVVCIIEAMKLMNEIESDCNGEVVEIYPQNGQAVEFGEPLFGIKVSS